MPSSSKTLDSTVPLTAVQSVIPIETIFPPNQETGFCDTNSNPHAWNGYMIYVQLRRHELSLRYPDYSTPDIGKVFGTMWRGLSDEERQLYDQMAHLCPDNHLGEIRSELRTLSQPPEDIRSILTIPTVSIGAYDKSEEDSVTDKKPNVWNGYMIFVQLCRHNFYLSDPQMGENELSKKFGEMWKNLTAEERCLYNEMAQICPDMSYIESELSDLALPPQNIAKMFLPKYDKKNRASSRNSVPSTSRLQKTKSSKAPKSKTNLSSSRKSTKKSGKKVLKKRSISKKSSSQKRKSRSPKAKRGTSNRKLPNLKKRSNSKKSGSKRLKRNRK